VEGVLLPKRRYLLFVAAKKLGLWAFAKIILFGVLYEVGLLSLESTLRKMFKLFKGLSAEEFFQLYKMVPIMPGSKEVFERLNKAGYATALISSGLPKRFVEDLAAELKADYAFGLELEVVNGRIKGEIGGDVLKPNGKAFVLKKILDKEGLPPKNCVLIADDRNNLQMFPLCALKVGYNPDFLLSAKSDFAVKGDLSEILPFVIENEMKVFHHTFSRSEVIRETIHISGFSVPFVCMYLLDSLFVALLIFSFTLLYIASELARMEGAGFPVLSTITKRAATRSELYEFATNPVFFAIGIALSLIIFPEPISYASVAILALGDGSAEIFGKKFGKNVFPLNKGKRIEGSVFGFLFAFTGAIIFLNPMKALVGAAVGTLMECLPLPISDNLTVPLTSGLIMTLLP
jgi:HAD superfamily phosphoserine phosphatase-like hydrolase